MGKGDRNWLLAVDESGSRATTYYGFGALVMSWERRGDFQALFREIRSDYGIESEAKWKRINKRTFDFIAALVDAFFRTRWLAFHCMVVRKADIAACHKNRDQRRL